MLPLPDRPKFHISDQLSNRWLIGDRSIFRLKLEEVGKSLGGDGKKSMELDGKIVLKSRRFGELKLIVRQSLVTNVTGNFDLLLYSYCTTWYGK